MPRVDSYSWNFFQPFGSIFVEIAVGKGSVKIIFTNDYTQFPWEN